MPHTHEIPFLTPTTLCKYTGPISGEGRHLPHVEVLYIDIVVGSCLSLAPQEKTFLCRQFCWEGRRERGGEGERGRGGEVGWMDNEGERKELAKHTVSQ